MPNGWNKPWPLGVLLFGLLMFVLAVISTFTGKTYLKRVTERTEDPSFYWAALITQYLCGVGLIWYYYYALAP
jgi:uncharacterized membrane protein